MTAQEHPDPAGPLDGGFTRYPNLRQMMDPRLEALSDAQLDGLFQEAFGEGVSPEEYEGFFGSIGSALSHAARDVGRFAQRAAPVAGTALSGAAQGAVAGSALGPWGALGGALVGGVGSALSQHTSGPARGVGQVLGAGMNVAGSLTGRGPGGVAGLLGTLTGGRPAGGAASQLGALLGNPAILQALQALATQGNVNVPLPGGRQVPAASVARMLGGLAREAADEAEGDLPEDAGTAGQPILAQGARNPPGAVRALQGALNRIHAAWVRAGTAGISGAPLQVDGVFGSRTRQAVRSFQRSVFPDFPDQHDGVVGPNTWALIQAYLDMIAPAGGGGAGDSADTGEAFWEDDEALYFLEDLADDGAGDWAGDWAEDWEPLEAWTGGGEA